MWKDEEMRGIVLMLFALNIIQFANFVRLNAVAQELLTEKAAPEIVKYVPVGVNEVPIPAVYDATELNNYCQFEYGVLKKNNWLPKEKKQ